MRWKANICADGQLGDFKTSCRRIVVVETLQRSYCVVVVVRLLRIVRRWLNRRLFRIPISPKVGGTRPPTLCGLTSSTVHAWKSFPRPLSTEMQVLLRKPGASNRPVFSLMRACKGRGIIDRSNKAGQRHRCTQLYKLTEQKCERQKKRR